MADESDDDSLPDLIDPAEALKDQKPASIKEAASANTSTPTKLAASSSGTSAVRATGAFTLEDALRCQEELYDGFTTDHFQRELVALGKTHKQGSMPFLKARQQLFLTVQKEVLPKYGFEGTLNGVFKLMGATQPFINDPEFKEMASKINDVLGVNSPPDTWGKLTENLNRKQPDKREEVPRAAMAEEEPLAPSRFRGATAAYLPGNKFGHLPSMVNGAGLSGLLGARARPLCQTAPRVPDDS